MSTEIKKEIQLEIAHVLFIDIVGYSKLSINDQHAAVEELNQVVRASEQFQRAESASRLLKIPTGDGIALVFYTSPEAPAQCAVEISRALKEHPRLHLRMGIHSGPVSGVVDLNERANLTGAGLNIAQRVMDCGDAGHILLSKHVAEDLEEYEKWRPLLHDLGSCEVKHGVRVSVVNLYDDQFGNAKLPRRFETVQKRRKRLRWVATAATLLALTAIVAGIALFSRYGVRTTLAAPEKSIAVLPFENFSPDKENAFFADGVQDDILTSLAQIGSLKVISRSSVMQFRDVASRNLREIGKTLGVANVLEGSVRREGARVVVNVQLIDALHGQHVGASHYDRTLANSLGLQGELAAEIADALRVTLSPEEKARVEKKPTLNPEAYLVYLEANQIERNPDTLLGDFKKAEQLYLQAIAFDANFALAHARLASTCAQVFQFHEPTESWKTKARGEADTALRLQPNLAEAHVALGQYMYWIDGDYDRALQEFEQALRLSPNNADVGGLIAAIRRRQGRWQEALEAFERSQTINPLDLTIARNIVFTNTALRRWPEASRAAERMRAMAPASLVAKVQSGYVDFWWKGDTKLLKSLLDQVLPDVDPDGVITGVRWDVAMLQRNYAAARNVLQTSSLSEISYTNAGLTPKIFLEGCISLAQGDTANAQKAFEVARPVFEASMKEAPGSADRHANLGWLYSFMGRKDDAIREGQRAVELRPESKDAFDGAIMNCYLALIYARVGQKDLAIQLIERLLKTPGAVDSVDYSITINDLKYRWEWDPIRNDPRFQKLIAEKAP